jgi:hypothetical protein
MAILEQSLAAHVEFVAEHRLGKALSPDLRLERLDRGQTQFILGSGTVGQQLAFEAGRVGHLAHRRVQRLRERRQSVPRVRSGRRPPRWPPKRSIMPG